MGACYSKKAKGGNRSYTTMNMASTKLEEASRLARPTPYTRTQNANLEHANKKNIPLSAKHNSMTTMDQGDVKNTKNTFQSSIPRFSSSLPVAVATPGNQRTVAVCNDNESLHVVNNNAIVNSRSAFNISNNASSPVNKVAKADSAIKPKSLGSRSCPDKIISPDVPEKLLRTPVRGSGILRSFGRFSPSSTGNSPDIHSVPKIQSAKESRSVNGRNSSGPSPISKSPSRKGFESRDSLSDFDSGLGNSLTDKNKPEDSDTVKDLEQLEFHEEFSPNLNVDSNPGQPTSTPKQSVNEGKNAVKAPIYRREPNGKWSFDEKHFGPESPRSTEPKPFPISEKNCPREKHSFKMNASENIFSTYASYKGLISYQKKSFKPLEVTKFSSKPGGIDKGRQIPSPNSSSIPKVRRQQSQPTPSGPSSVFYVHNESGDCSFEDDDKTLQNVERKTKKRQAKQSSQDSDEKSDSTENGILSPPSDDNREFLIDDEIADQPGLTFGDPKSEDSDVQSLKLAMSELHALQMSSSVKMRTDSVGSYSSRKGRNGDHRDSLLLNSELGSSCSSIASDDLMLDYEKTFDGFPEGTVNEGPASPMRKMSETEVDKIAPLKSDKKFDFEDKGRKRLIRRSSNPLSSSGEKDDWRKRAVSLPLRPPRQMTAFESDDGGLKLDSSSYRLLCQDLNGVKTLLLRLKSVIQEAETINPFDQTNPNNIFYHSLVQNDFPSTLTSLKPATIDEKKGPDVAKIYQENADLSRQLVLLQQQLEDKDHTIHLLQQQMTKYLNVQNVCNHDAPSSNAATQTERSHSLTSSLSSNSSADDSIETLVSVQDDFEKSFRKNSKEQDVLTEHLNEVIKLLDQTCTIPPHSEC